MSTMWTRANEAAMSLADEIITRIGDEHDDPDPRDQAEAARQIELTQADFSTIADALNWGAKYEAALRELDAFEPEQFKTRQDHLSPGFREVNFRDAFVAVIKVVNKVLHNTNEYGKAL